MRDVDKLVGTARSYGAQIGIFAAGLLDSPLPWTKMRQVYRLLGLVRRFGAGPVEQACRQAPQCEAIDVGLLARMLERGREAEQVALAKPGSNLVPLRFARSSDELAVTAPRAVSVTMTETISADLKADLRRLRLSPMLATLAERINLARQTKMPYQDFLQLIVSDEISRRERILADLRARSARLDPGMRLEAWDDSAAVAFDRELWSELVSLRFVEDAQNLVIMGPVGVGKTFMATALGHIACRRRRSVLFSRTDRLLKRLKAFRLDQSYEAEMKRLIRVDLLILDDFALHAFDQTETGDVYELVVERHLKASTIVTSNREPSEWIDVMSDRLLAQSAIDRLQSAASELVDRGRVGHLADRECWISVRNYRAGRFQWIGRRAARCCI